MKTSSVRIWRRKRRWRSGNWATNLGHHSDHAASLVVREVSKLPVNVRPLQGCSSTTPSWKERTPGCNWVGHGPVVAGVLVFIHHPLGLLHVEPLPSVDLRVDVVRGDVGHVLGEALVEPHLVPPEDIHLARGGKVDSPVQCDNVAEPLVRKLMSDHIEHPKSVKKKKTRLVAYFTFLFFACRRHCCCQDQSRGLLYQRS